LANENLFNAADNSLSKINCGVIDGECHIIQNVSKSVLNVNTLYLGEDLVEQYYVNLNNNVNRFNVPIRLNPSTATFEDVAIYAMKRGNPRLAPGTVMRNIRYARFMENHICSVDFRNPSYDNFIQHMDYREEFEKAGHGALKHEWNTVRMFLMAYGIPYGKGTTWNYSPPPAPGRVAKILPSPEIVHKIVSYDYTKDGKSDYESALLGYTLLHNFMIGWRVPSEPFLMTIDNVRLDTGMLIIVEGKKHFSTRPFFPGDTLMFSRYRKSFRNWIDIWRPKVENQYSGNALYLQEDGKPIGKEQYRMFLSRAVKSIWPEFQPNISRSWCATGLLIREYLNTKHWNKDLVRDCLGHDRERTTTGYVKDARQYIRKYDFDWFKRVLKFHDDRMKEENSLKSIQCRKTCVSSGNSSSDENAVRRTRTGDRSVNSRVLHQLS